MHAYSIAGTPRPIARRADAAHQGDVFQVGSASAKCTGPTESARRHPHSSKLNVCAAIRASSPGNASNPVSRLGIVQYQILFSVTVFDGLISETTHRLAAKRGGD